MEHSLEVSTEPDSPARQRMDLFLRADLTIHALRVVLLGTKTSPPRVHRQHPRMAAFAQTASGMSKENHITISPATSNKDAEFTYEFDHVFRTSTLQAAFEHHAAFTAVFKSKPQYNEHDKFGGKFVRCGSELVGGFLWF